MAKSLEIVGRYEGERFRFDNGGGPSTVIGKVRLVNGSKEAAEKAGIKDVDGLVSVKGQADVDELEYRKTYRFLGVWSSYFNRRQQQKEMQFAFRTFVPHIPHDKESLIDYLAAAGRGNGIGPSKANILVESFGVDGVLEQCRTNPKRIQSLLKLRPGQSDAFAAKLIEQQATENATLEVDKLLSGRGFPKTLVRKVIKEWGNRAAEVIQDDPYALMLFRGCGFRLTDKLYIALGKDPESIDRQALCLWYSMASNTEGHTWFRATDQCRDLQRMIGSANVDPVAAIKRGKEYGQASPDRYGAIASLRTDGPDGPLVESGGTFWIAEGKNAAAEEQLASSIAKATSESFAQSITTYEDVECTESKVLQHARCHRCNRQLTAETVHVLNGIPYGPTCIGYVDPVGVHEVFPLRDWLEQNPVVLKWIEQHPKGIIDLPDLSLWPDVSEIAQCSVNGHYIDEHQQEQLAKALVGRIGLLGGSPGTGKTLCTAATIKALVQSGRVGWHDIGIGAPTGKAAVRLTEMLQAAGLQLRARTWHSLLGIGETSADGGWSFRHNASNPWPFRVIIGDESSMPDLPLMRSIFAARPPGCHVLMVGDVNQLPPVGNGAPFRDMIAAGLPYGELTEIKRNSGGIVEACAAIRDQKPWVHQYLGEEHNLQIWARNTTDSQYGALTRIVDNEGGDDPKWNCQVVVAVNQRSDLSRKAVNAFLQGHLNPNPKVKGTIFREADKIVCLKNGFYSSAVEVDFTDEDLDSNDQGEVYVANGELACVDSVEPKYLLASLKNPDRTIRIPLGKSSEGDDEEPSGTGCNWDLGYALSVHKCVHPDTLVETDRGIIPIRNITDRGVIATPYGVKQFKNRVYFRSRECLEITTTDGDSITVTTDHKCEAWNGEAYELIEASKLSEGQFVRSALFPAMEPLNDAILPPRADEDVRCKDCLIPTLMTPDLAEFLGLMVADGTVYRAGIRLGKRHPEVAKRFTELCWDLFGLKNKEYEALGMLVSECNSTAVRDWLYKVGGCFPKFKHVPECILQSRQNIHAAFLRGLFEDGCVNVKNGKVDHIEWMTCFPRLDREVRLMLHRLGIICGRNSQKRRSVQLYIYGEQAKRFGSVVGFISKAKQDRLLLPAGRSIRYAVPLHPEWIEENRMVLSKPSLQNARSRGYLSRHSVELVARDGCIEAEQLLKWHHSRIASIRPTAAPAMCVEVPEGNRFMQNGFPWGNSQGSEFPVVIVLLDSYTGARMVCDRSWVYTAISRAQNKCFLVGKPDLAERFCRVQKMDRRRTFLTKQIALASLEQEMAGL